MNTYHSKRLQNLKIKILTKKYSCDEGIKLLKTLKNINFIESVEAHFNLNINPKIQNQQIKSNLILPYPIKKDFKIAIFTDDPVIKNNYKNDESIIVFDLTSLMENITKNILNFNLLLTTPHLINQLTKFGKILSPKNLMPSIKQGTITENLEKSVNEFKKGKIEYKSDKTGIIHINIGKKNFSFKKLKENLIFIYKSIEKNKPTNFKGIFFKSLYLCTTMSPSINIDLLDFKQYSL